MPLISIHSVKFLPRREYIIVLFLVHIASAVEFVELMFNDETGLENFEGTPVCAT